MPLGPLVTYLQPRGLGVSCPLDHVFLQSLAVTVAPDVRPNSHQNALAQAKLLNAPLRLGATEAFACVCALLRDVDFTEHFVTAALNVANISNIPNRDHDAVDGSSVSTRLATMIDFFVLGLPVEADRLRTNCGEAAFAAMRELGLIRDAQNPNTLICPVWIYPVDGFFIASDRRDKIGLDSRSDVTEVVFPALDAGTLELLRLLPIEHGSTALDLCGGSGIGALHLARSGRRAVTADITLRSAHFAAWNAKLNGADIEVLCGDLYEPIGDRRFDVIAAHPPWVPSTGDDMVFRDGGDTGEAIVERLFADLPRHLNPHGTAVVVALGRDARDASYEQRVRGWLGDAGGDCDIILGVDKIMSIESVVNSIRNLHLNDDGDRAARIAHRFRELGTEKFVYGAAFVRRTDSTVREPPLRLRMTAAAAANDFDKIFRWRQHSREPRFADWLATTTPHLSADLEANIRYVARHHAMVPDSAILNSKRPLAATVQPDVWLAQLIMRLDGKRTLEQIFESALTVGDVPSDFTLPAFANVIGHMVERGIVDVALE